MYPDNTQAAYLSDCTLYQWQLYNLLWTAVIWLDLRCVFVHYFDYKAHKIIYGHVKLNDDKHGIETRILMAKENSILILEKQKRSLYN